MPESRIEIERKKEFFILYLASAPANPERANSRLYGIAKFLQVTGLIPVLARDLRRHQQQ